jgi:catechol 2,3-dioxygenase-like lactoylglutathione lyase family enzyme
MKRFHVHLGVNDLERSIGFYSHLFGAEPTVRKDDYAKWMLDDPRINFAISRRGNAVGVNHLGLQVESDDELKAVRGQFAAADATATVDEPGANCCYAKSDKHWVTDPQGVAWEAFHPWARSRCSALRTRHPASSAAVRLDGDRGTGGGERVLRTGNRRVPSHAALATRTSAGCCS